jgi:hypothetical protein
MSEININDKNLNRLRSKLFDLLFKNYTKFNTNDYNSIKKSILFGQRKKVILGYNKLTQILEAQKPKQKIKKMTNKQLLNAIFPSDVREKSDVIQSPKEKDVSQRRLAVFARFRYYNVKTKKSRYETEQIAVQPMPKAGTNIKQYINEKYTPDYADPLVDSIEVRYLEELSFKVSAVPLAKGKLDYNKIMMKESFVLRYDWLKFAQGIDPKSYSDMDGMCVYKLLVDHLKHRWTTVDEKALFNIFSTYHQNKHELDVDYEPLTIKSGVSTEMIHHLCELKNISLYAFDSDEKCFIKRLGNNKYKPIAYYVIDSHMYLITNKSCISSITNSGKRVNLDSSLVCDAVKRDEQSKQECREAVSFSSAFEYTDSIVFIPGDDLTYDLVEYMVKQQKISPLVKSKVANKITSIHIKSLNLTICVDINKRDGLTWKDIKSVCDAVGVPFKNQTIGTLIQQIKKQYFTIKRDTLDDKQKNELIEKQRNKCNHCYEPLKKGCFEFDHIHPLCRGGSNEFSNFQILCQECHKTKSIEDTQELIKYNSMTSSFNLYTQQIVRSKFFLTMGICRANK